MRCLESRRAAWLAIGGRNVGQGGPWVTSLAEEERRARWWRAALGGRPREEGERTAASYWGRRVLVWGEDNTAGEEYRHEGSGRAGADSRDTSAEVACPSAVDGFIETYGGEAIAANGAGT